MTSSCPEIFAPRGSIEEIEHGLGFMPKFDADGLLPVVATDAETGEFLMLAYMNAEALAETITSRRATYWSRSRNQIWRKGETSGNVQHVVEIRTDCDQDAIWIRVKMEGHSAACHMGYVSCFHRAVPEGSKAGPDIELVRMEDRKTFDPGKVYGDMK